MSLQKMISEIETERAHNRVMGNTFSAQMQELKVRIGEEIDALVNAFLAEIEARDKALAGMVTGDATNA